MLHSGMKKSMMLPVSSINMLLLFHCWKYVLLMTNTLFWRHQLSADQHLHFFHNCFLTSQAAAVGNTSTYFYTALYQEYVRTIEKKQFLLLLDQVPCSERWIWHLCFSTLSLWPHKQPQMWEFLQITSKWFCVPARMVTRNSLPTVRVIIELWGRS